MKKLLLLFCALLCLGGSKAWAEDVTVINSSVAPTTYGSFSSPTFTTNAESGLAGVTITGFNTTTATNFSYGACLGAKDIQSGTITLVAPSGYYITGYSLTAKSNTWSVSYTLTPSAGGSAVTTSTSGVNLNVSGLKAQETTFTYSGSSVNTFYVPSFTISLEEADDAINVTYNLYESDGETFVNSIVRTQDKNSAVSIPSSLTELQYYDYSYTGTIGETDCTIKVTRTIKSGHVIALSGLDNEKKYNIKNNRGWWAVANDATEINSTTKLSIATSSSDTKQQFAFVYYDDDYDDVFDGYYLYSVNVGKFAYVDGTKLSLTALDVLNSTAPSKVTFQSSTCFAFKNSDPTVVTLGGSSYGVHNATPGVYQYSPHLEDAGNASSIEEAGDFDDTDAVTAIENLRYPSLGDGNTYTFNITKQNDPSTPYYLSTTTSATAVNFVVEDNGTNAQGRQVYSLKNAETGKYLNYDPEKLGKSTSSGDTRLSYSDSKTYSKFLFSKDYNGKVTIRPASASDQNYLTAWNWNNPGYNVNFFTRADGMSYWTVTLVAKAVTYNLKWKGETIASKRVSVPIEGSTEDYLPWDIPYCDFEYDVATVTPATSEVNVTMTWDGPFDFSTSFSDATWYYMKVNGKYAIKEATYPYTLSSDKQDAVDHLNNALWGFMGNPYSIQIINKASGDNTFLNSYDGYGQVTMTSLTDYCLWSINDEVASGFTFNNGGWFLYDTSSGLGSIGDWNYITNTLAAVTIETPYADMALAELETYVSSHALGSYFGVDETLYNATKSSIEEMSGSFNKAAYNTVVNSLESLIKYPETGYYRIYNATRGRYMGTEDGTPMTLDDATSASTVVKLVYDGEGNTYKIKMQGMELDTPALDVLMSMSASGADFTAEGTAGIAAFKVSNAYVHAGNSGNSYKLLGYDAPAVDAASGWTVTDATTVNVSLSPIGDYTYATLGLPFGVTLPADVKAYILTVSGEWAIPTEISEVPAGTGVLLRGTSSSVTSATLTINDAASATTDGNKLVPTYVDITDARSAGEYILGNDATDGLGFYQRKSDRKIGANKAYLQLDADLAASVKGLLLNFDELVDGIGLTPAPSPVSERSIFNLAGQRMSRVQKGVNIVNGKKVLVK